jgi:hypothetical protein
MHSTGIIKCLLKIVKRNNQVYVYEYKLKTVLFFTENKWKRVNCSKGLSISRLCWEVGVFSRL